MTGTTLHTVSRILSAWEQQGLVEGGRQRIVLAMRTGYMSSPKAKMPIRRASPHLRLRLLVFPGEF